MLTINKTQQYHIFKKSANRKIVERHVQNIIAEYQKNPQTFQSSPIVVSHDLTVIDGQHRLEAAKRLHQPIYYIKDESIIDADQIHAEIMKRNVNQLQWKMNDYIDFYADQGKEEYLFIKKIKDQSCCLSLSAIFILCETTAAHQNKTKFFKSGDFIVLNKEKLIEFCPLFTDCIVSRKFNTKEKKIILCREYVKGLYDLYFNPLPRISFEIFMKRMPQKANELRYPRNIGQAEENIHHICRSTIQS